MQAISSRVHAFMLALINGERSMRDMARMLVEQRLMSAQEAEACGADLPRAAARGKRVAVKMGTFLISCHKPELPAQTKISLFVTGK